jgi:hypothetical protein
VRALLQSETAAERRKIHKVCLKLHKLKAKIFYEDCCKWEEKGMQNADTQSLSFDFLQNFPFPHLPINELYYKRQMLKYNFCIYTCKYQRGTTFMWSEFKEHDGFNEVVFYLDYYITHILLEKVRGLHLFSDACSGQNLYHTMMHYPYSIVNLGKLDKITHHLHICGHSYLPYYRLFSITGHLKKKHEKV